MVGVEVGGFGLGGGEDRRGGVFWWSLLTWLSIRVEL